MHPLAEKYLRKTSLPTIFCPGCGDGTILNVTLRVLDKLGIEKFSFVSGIGCSSWLPVFINADVMHTMHGRALSIATGLKLAQPDRKVVVFSGDGDCLGIGGNHLIHAARRNMDLTVVLVNNYIYGMTGGQMSPTTPLKSKTKTSPYGSHEPVFDAAKLVVAAGGGFVARESTANPRSLAGLLEKAIAYEGFSLIDVITQCPVQAGRNMFGDGEPRFLFAELKRRSVKNLDAELESGQFHTGVLHHAPDKPAYKPFKV